MNKHTNLLGVLGLTVLETHSSVMPFTKSHVRLTEEQLDSIESSLAANDVSGLTEKINTLTSTVDANTASMGVINTAIASAFEANGLELTEGTSAADAISTLSATCKKHGESTNTHSIIKNNGIENNASDAKSYIDPEAEHNQIIAKVFNR